LRGRGAEVVAVSVLIDRSAGEAAFDCPFSVLAKLDMQSWPPDDCALCRENAPLVDPDDLTE
jgi:orotate phosphoribosyltransferase